MIVKKGATRIVFIFNKIVIKIPNFINGYKFILLGLLSNLTENEWNGFSNKLCPVIFTFPFGLFSIMKKAEPILDENYIIPLDYFNGLPYDNSNNNFGYLDGVLVLVDYGEWIREATQCMGCGKFLDEIK